MGENGLRHLAIVAAAPMGASGDEPGTVTGAARVAAAMADEAFATVPDLEAFSFLSPGIERLLAEPASAPAVLHGCVEAAAILAESAARCGAVLRLCGRAEGLPAALSRYAVHPPAAVADRTLLWFLRYGGRDEIARAATRFFRSRPEGKLADEELDVWLDTSGIPDPDLIILAGGAFEVPDALVWQGSYAEFWHSATPWSAFTVGELRRALADFNDRQRRFGG